MAHKILSNVVIDGSLNVRADNVTPSGTDKMVIRTSTGDIKTADIPGGSGGGGIELSITGTNNTSAMTSADSLLQFQLYDPEGSWYLDSNAGDEQVSVPAFVLDPTINTASGTIAVWCSWQPNQVLASDLTSGAGVMLLVTSNGVVYGSRSISSYQIKAAISNPDFYTRVFSLDVSGVPKGRVEILALAVSNDTNTTDMGTLVAQVSEGSTFTTPWTVSVVPTDGGTAANITTLEEGYQYSNWFDSTWGPVATGGTVSVGNTNPNLSGTVEVLFSTNTELNYTGTFTAGTAFTHSISLTLEQLQNNDVFVQIVVS